MNYLGQRLKNYPEEGKITKKIIKNIKKEKEKNI